jgi:hypothetical protein
LLFLFQGERKMAMLVVIIIAFIIHVFGVYFWYRNDDLVRPLVLLPPKEIPPFWHAIFFIAVNGILSFPSCSMNIIHLGPLCFKEFPYDCITLGSFVRGLSDL